MSEAAPAGCPACGAPVAPAMNWCPTCGAALNTALSTATALAPPIITSVTGAQGSQTALQPYRGSPPPVSPPPPTGTFSPGPAIPPPPRAMSGRLKVFLVLFAIAAVAALGSALLIVLGVGKASHDLNNALTPNPGRPAGYRGPPYPGMITQDHVANATGEVQDYGEAVTALNLRHVPGLFGASLCADVSLTNRSQQTKDVGPVEWKLQDPDSTVHTLGFAGTLQTGQIAPGGSARGSVCLPDSGQSGTFVLIWQPLQLRADRGVWLFSL